MGKLRVHNIEAQTGTNVDLGAAGDVVTLASDSLQTNLYKDSGANTIFQSDGAGTLSNVNSVLVGNGPKLITSSPGTGVTSIDFTSGIGSTYDKYMFVITGWNPNTNGHAGFFNGSIDGGSNYNVTKTSIGWETGHNDSGVSAAPVVYAGVSLAQSTAYQQMNNGPGSAADHSMVCIVNLYSPASTTYVKQYTVTSNVYSSGDYSYIVYIGGYFNTTSAINAMRFEGYSGGTFDAKIKMYGVA